jgi:hypothetical protein
MTVDRAGRTLKLTRNEINHAYGRQARNQNNQTLNGEALLATASKASQQPNIEQSNKNR